MSTVTAVPLQPVKRGYLVWLWLGIALAVIAAFALAAKGASVSTTASGLHYKVLKRGDAGRHPTDSDVALVNYEGRLTNGTTFDKSPQPTPMQVGGVVPGFAEGLKLMTKGAKYRFWIPPALGYGPAANGPIPANSTLIFDVELVDFRSEAEIRQMQMMQQMQRGGAGMPGAGAPPAP